VKAAALASVLLAGAASAQDQPIAQVPDEFVRLFTGYCLAKFPDDAALKDKVQADKREPLSQAQVQSYLHADPGVGWLVGEDGKYVLTVEQPPYHGCAIRRYVSEVMDSKALFAAASDFLAPSGRKLGPPQTTQRAIGPGIVSSGVLMPVIGASGQLSTEGFMFFVVSYPAGTKPDGTERPAFYDIRFVRQMYEKAV
jgi:hypothetical protein